METRSRIPTSPWPPLSPPPSPGAVVRDRQLDVAVAVPDDDLGMAGARVLDRVGQPLLDEPVGGEVDARRQRLGRPLDPELDGQPELARVRDQPVQVLEARLGCERGRLLRAPEHADHAPHLGERLAAGLLDDEQGLALLLLVRLEEPPRRRRLDGHHADAVADDVVELPRDAAALVGDGELRLLDPLSLGPLEAFLRHLRLVALAAEAEPDRPADREEDADEDEVAHSAPGIVVGDDRGDAGPEARGRRWPVSGRGGGRSGRTPTPRPAS